MASARSQKANLPANTTPSVPSTRSPAPAIPVHPAPPATNGKKAKKKKGKGKEPSVQNATRPLASAGAHGCLEDPDLPLPPTATGPSPTLESVRITTTGYLSASAAAVARSGAGMNGANGSGIADDEYWSSFPPHIKNFAQTMYNIAQQMGIPGYPPGAYPPLPFDPSIFSDPAFTLSVEQAAAAALGAAPPAPGQPPRGPLPQANVVLLNEFGGGQHELAEDDYYSEDEVDGDFEDEDLEDEFDMKPHPARPPAIPQPKLPGSMADGVAHVVLTATGPQQANNPGTKITSPAAERVTADDLPSNTKQKKRKDLTKTPATPPVAPSVPYSAGTLDTCSAHSAPVSAPEMGTTHPTAAVDLTKRPPLTANAMPAVRAATKENISTNPPPSSRAQGKQPMSYAPTTTPGAATTTNTTTATTTAPITPHAYSHNHTHHHPSSPSSNASAPHKPRPPAGSGSNKGSQNNSKIWSTSTTEERERIKEFWLGLGEDERRNLVKIEKDTVLKKMKEQQKHSCSCAVCGRKRHAIEEELEVLYDAYYEELEQYANYQQRYVNSGGTIPPPPGPGPFPGSVELDKNGDVIGHPHSKPSHHPPRSNRTPALTNGRKPPKHESEFEDDEGDDDDYEEEDEYDDDEEEEEEDDDGAEDEEEEEEDAKPRDRRTAGTRARRPVNGTKPNGRDGLFNLGSSLTVTGPNNILTVADDLLKNDGQKFLEMMEQLAERRMQREEEAAADVEDDSDEEEDEDGDEDDDEDEEDEEDEDEDDDEEVMTEEQKMEEGKRMFSIFAARMFEQRVLQAYREKVAQERQQQLLRELEDEDKLTREREAKKQTQNQKKKDKKKQQKQAKEEEKAAKAAEKAAEDAALKAKQLAQEEESRKRREEERTKREAARKAAEDEKQRKDEERRKRIAEEREREAERERKRKEKEERAKQERREREEKERKAKEEREAKAAVEKAAREAARKEQQEKEEKEKKLAKEREEKAEKDRVAQQQRTVAKNARQPTSPRASGSAQRSHSTNGTTKKILNKPTPTPAPVANSTRTTPQRPMVTTSQPATPVASSAQNLFPPPSTPMYPPGTGMIPPTGAMSPRMPYAPPPPFGLFGPGPSMQQGPPPSLAPSALPRKLWLTLSFRPTAAQNPLASPTMLAAGPSRRVSMPEPGPGPVARPVSIAPIAPIAPPAPIAPIARPTTGEASGSGSGSPVRRSPSPKGVLGSSALAADDDEVVPPPGRRMVPGAVGQELGGTLWGSVSPETPWQSPTGFFPNTFVNPINPTPTPHTGN
ncbi:salt tolerance down-regulator-domain-containing protein [Melanogaster broomeanus]|nr:salt tolerance down-regulator-domain-containing protein [Melanogaster broomeanus]